MRRFLCKYYGEHQEKSGKIGKLNTFGCNENACGAAQTVYQLHGFFLVEKSNVLAHFQTISHACKTTDPYMHPGCVTDVVSVVDELRKQLSASMCFYPSCLLPLFDPVQGCFPIWNRAQFLCVKNAILWRALLARNLDFMFLSSVSISKQTVRLQIRYQLFIKSLARFTPHSQENTKESIGSYRFIVFVRSMPSSRTPSVNTCCVNVEANTA